MAYYSRPEELLKRFVELFKLNQGMLDIKYVATQEESLIPEYPALQISMGDVLREDHGTQRFLLTFEASFWIYHANYESTRAVRNIEDMELATKVVRFLHVSDNRALREGGIAGENKLIGGSGRVVREIPGFVFREAGARIVTTRLMWTGQTQVNYQDS